jgi:hypothetical protein
VGTLEDEQACRFFLYTGQLDALGVEVGIRSDGSEFTEFPDGSAAATDGGTEMRLPDGGTVATKVQYRAISFCQSAAREAVSSYRLPDAIIDMAFKPASPYFQYISGGTYNYYSTFYANTTGGAHVPNSPEVYAYQSPFLIAAGGLAEPNGLPEVTTGAIADSLLDAFGGLVGSDGVVEYSYDGEDVGISLPVLLLPNNPNDQSAAQNDLDPVHPNPGVRPYVNRNDLVQIIGSGHGGANLCVAPGFACGKKATMPKVAAPNTITAGPWQFADLPSEPTHTYVAMLTVTPYLISPGSMQFGSVPEQPVVAPYNIGLFEAEPASGFANLSDFQAQVERNNPAGASLFVANNATIMPLQGIEFALPSPPCGELIFSCEAVLGWSGHYVMTNGSEYDFQIPVDTILPSKSQGGSPGFDDPQSPSPFGSYPITSQNVLLPPTDPTTWGLAEGEFMQANRNGVINIVDLNTNVPCHLDIEDPTKPLISGCTVTCSPTCSVNFPCTSGGDCQSKICTNGVCAPPSCAAEGCPTNAVCGSNLDCSSGLCLVGKCAPSGSDSAPCRSSNDCTSFVCTDGLCRAPSCAPSCSHGAPCGAPSDCGSGVCTGGQCEHPNCYPGCANGLTCGDNGDCASFQCRGNVCVPSNCAPTCNQGAPCGAPADCASRICTGGLCQPPACSPECPAGSACANNGDCASFTCSNFVCTGAASSPDASVPDSGQDGGRPSCSSKCPNATECTNNNQCASYVCGGGACQPPSCSPSCNQGAPCGSSGDCGSRVCTSGICSAPSCSPKCTSGSACNNNGDCASFVCSNSICQ